MIFCNRVSVNDKYAVYKYGPDPDNLSGLVRVYAERPRIVVEQQPKEKKMQDNLLIRIWLKYQESIKKGEFPEKMSIQIG